MRNVGKRKEQQKKFENDYQVRRSLRQESCPLSWLKQPLISGPKVTLEMVF